MDKYVLYGLIMEKRAASADTLWKSVKRFGKNFSTNFSGSRVKRLESKTPEVMSHLEKQYGNLDGIQNVNKMDVLGDAMNGSNYFKGNNAEEKLKAFSYLNKHNANIDNAKYDMLMARSVAGSAVGASALGGLAYGLHKSNENKENK